MRICLLKIDTYYLKFVTHSECFTSISDGNSVRGRLALNYAQDHFFPVFVIHSAPISLPTNVIHLETIIESVKQTWDKGSHRHL